MTLISFHGDAYSQSHENIEISGLGGIIRWGWVQRCMNVNGPARYNKEGPMQINHFFGGEQEGRRALLLNNILYKKTQKITMSKRN
jgi:hypothetical protein